MLVAEHLIERDIVGDNPAYPGENTESLEDVPRKEVPKETTREGINEKSLPGYTPALPYSRVLLCMQGVEERTSNKIRGPDWKESYTMKDVG
jgi:hypothetical protein